jgi:uncharacterized protein (TIGR01319 family)
MITMQTGRDLTNVPSIIGTGGYLSAAARFDPLDSISMLGTDQYGKRILAPRHARYLRDHQYLFPLLANVATAYPEAAVREGLLTLVADNQSLPRCTSLLPK